MSNQEVKKYKVIIVGAGAAGLGAAQHLAKNGCKDFVVLEANNRIGGRIHTVPFGSTSDNLIEMGANWIHGGTMANPLLTQMCQHFTPSARVKKIPYLKRFHKIAFAKSNGRLVELELGARAVDHFFRVEREAYRLYFRPTNNISSTATLVDYMQANLERLTLAEYAEDEQHDVRCVFNSLLAYLRFHVGDDLENVSLKEYGSFQEIPGGDVILPGGFQNLVQTLANGLPAESILTGQVVKEISWSVESGRSAQVTVTCEHGGRFQADHVIVTVSLGHLKKHHRTLFDPKLPVDKERSITSIGFGCTNKIFLEFDRPFWNAGFGNIGFGWTADELAKAAPDEWEKSIYGLEEVYDNPNVLAAWIAGRSADIMETVPEAEVARRCLALLKRFTGNDNIPPIKRLVRSTWRTNPFSCGSYSYPTAGTGPEQIRILARPLPSEQRPVLLFAGEATHANFFSTVHGAYLSGVREAQRILYVGSMPIVMSRL